GGGEIGRDPGLWAALFGAAALASLWPVDPWTLTLLALGGVGCALGPATMWPPPPGRAALATTAGVVGLLVFATLAAAQLRGGGDALLSGVVGYPALARGRLRAVARPPARRVSERPPLLNPTLAACLGITAGSHVAVYLLNATLPL